MTGQSERKRKYYSHPVTIEKRKEKKEEEEEIEEREGEEGREGGGEGRGEGKKENDWLLVAENEKPQHIMTMLLEAPIGIG